MRRSIEAKSGDMVDSADGPAVERRQPIESALLLERIIGELPLGLCVKAVDGAPLYANAAAKRHGADRLPVATGPAVIAVHPSQPSRQFIAL